MHSLHSWPWRAGLVLAAVGAALTPTPAPLVERLYSTSAYLAWQARATTFSNGVSFALLDVVMAATLLGWIAALAIDVRRRFGWLRGAARLAVRTGVLAAALYLAFLLAWGLNYRRVPLAEKLQFEPAGVSPDAAGDLAIASVDRVNALHDRAHAAMSGAAASDSRLAGAFAEVQRELGAARLAVPAHPKHTLLDFYFRAAGVEGMTDPYLLETLVPRDLLPFERPFVVAHEWSHLAGYADEGEASFVGWLTCLRAAEADQYSGWLFLFGEMMPAVAPADRARIAQRLAPGPRDDRRAIAERQRRNVSPRIAVTGWRVYDRYLKANRVEAGAVSYADVVRLALGTRFGPGWTPLMRRSPG